MGSRRRLGRREKKERNKETLKSRSTESSPYSCFQVFPCSYCTVGSQRMGPGIILYLYLHNQYLSIQLVPGIEKDLEKCLLNEYSNTRAKL